MNFRLRRPIPWFKIMKITFSQILIAVVLSSFAYASPVRAQNILDKPVNISLNNTPLLDVVNYLQKKNNIKFIYSKNTVDMSQKVNANFKEQPLKVVLDELFKNNGIDYEELQDRIVLGQLPADMLQNVYANFKDHPLKVVLDELFKNNGIEKKKQQDHKKKKKQPTDMLPVN